MDMSRVMWLNPASRVVKRRSIQCVGRGLEWVLGKNLALGSFWRYIVSDITVFLLVFAR